MAKKELTKEQQAKIIRRIKHTYECEKMPLTPDDEEGLKKMLNGEKTREELVAEEIAKMQSEGLIK